MGMTRGEKFKYRFLQRWAENAHITTQNYLISKVYIEFVRHSHILKFFNCNRTYAAKKPPGFEIRYHIPCLQICVDVLFSI